MTKRFRKIISILCALALLAACTGTAFATEEPPVETPDEAVTDVVTGEGPGADEGDETPAETPGETPAAGNNQDGSGENPAEIPEGNLPADGNGEKAEGEEGGDNTPSGTEPGQTEVVSDPVTIEEAVEQANTPADGEPPAGDNTPTEEETPADVTPPADQTGGQEETGNPPAENEPEGDPQEGGQQDGQEDEQENEPESESGEDPVIEPEEDPVIEPEQDEDENEQEEEPEDESEDESGEEQDESEDLIVLKLGERTQVSSVVTREHSYTLKAVDDYSRIMIFTLEVPEDSVSVTVNDTPITLNKAEDEDPEKVNTTYTFEYPILQGEEYIITLNAEQDGYIPFDLSMELKPEEEPEEEIPETPEESTDGEEGIKGTDSGLESKDAKPEFTLPDDRCVDFTISFDEEEPTIGCVAHFKAQLSGYEGIIYSLQWQKSLDCEAWEDEPNANQETMDVLMTDESSQYYWRLKVIIDITENI